jgi:hypothetical protein
MGVVMPPHDETFHPPGLLDVVALLVEIPDQQLTRGQVGTVVELLDDVTVLIDFSDDHGQTYAIAPCSVQDLLVLHYIREAA